MGYALAIREAGPEYGARADARAERIDELSERLGTLVGHIHAGMYRYLELVSELLGLEAWEWEGHRSPAHWLSNHTGFDRGTCREHVRVARALEALPVTSAAMSRGELSFSKVRALTRAAAPDTERDLVELARGCTTSQLEHVVRAWKKLSRRTEAALAEELHRSRKWSVFPDHEGMYVGDIRLEPEVAAVLEKAVEAASDALYRERHVPGLAGGRLSWPAFVEGARREAARLRADAIGLVAERALAVGFGGRAVDDETEAGEGSEAGEGPEAVRGAPLSGSRADRYQVVLHVEPDTLSADREPGRSELEDGTRVSAETSRRLACDAGLVRVTRGKSGGGTREQGGARGGAVLDVGRKTRTIPPALRRALEIRDRGCRFPGCGHRFTEGHHIRHWADGGETSLANTVLLCRYHHRLVHEGGWSIERRRATPGDRQDPLAGRCDRIVFRDPRGQLHCAPGWERGPGASRGGRSGRGPSSRPRTPGSGSIEHLLAENRRRGVDPEPDAAHAKWQWESMIPEDLLSRVLEALA